MIHKRRFVKCFLTIFFFFSFTFSFSVPPGLLKSGATFLAQRDLFLDFGEKNHFYHSKRSEEPLGAIAAKILRWRSE